MSTTTPTERPWGRAVAMLTASYVTLVGLWFQLDPEVILIRSLAAAVVACIATRIVVGMLPFSRDTQ